LNEEPSGLKERGRKARERKRGVTEEAGEGEKFLKKKKVK